jgi:hypothetical protein
MAIKQNIFNSKLIKGKYSLSKLDKQIEVIFKTYDLKKFLSNLPNTSLNIPTCDESSL